MNIANAYFASNKKAKIRLVFGVVHIAPRDISWGKLEQATSADTLEDLSPVKNSYLEILKQDICYEDVGIEFIYSPEVAYALAKVIHMAVLYKGKRPENIHIYFLSSRRWWL